MHRILLATYTLVKLIFGTKKDRFVVIFLCTIKPHIVIEIENDYYPDLHGYIKIVNPAYPKNAQ